MYIWYTNIMCIISTISLLTYQNLFQIYSSELTITLSSTFQVVEYKKYSSYLSK